jgi:hypothetical protein
LAGTSLLEYHFIFGVPILALFSAIFIDFLSIKFKTKQNLAINIFLLIIIIFSFFILINHNIFKKGEVTKMMDYNKNIEKDSLVVVDSRVYRGRIFWIFNDKHFLEGNYFINLANNLNDIQGEITSVKTYFTECVTDDCGWGTVNNQPEFNASMENLVSFFKNNSNHLGTISNKDNEPYFNVYSTNLILKDSVLNLADLTHEWFYYPLKYEKESFDDYTTKGFGKILDLLAHLILYLEILIALCSIILIFYLLIKSEKDLE